MNVLHQMMASSKQFNMGPVFRCSTDIDGYEELNVIGTGEYNESAIFLFSFVAVSYIIPLCCCLCLVEVQTMQDKCGDNFCVSEATKVIFFHSIKKTPGAYGTVYKARDRKNADQIVALKKVRVALTEDGIPMNTLREIALLKQLETFKHPNIVKWVIFGHKSISFANVGSPSFRLLDVCHGQRLEREKQLVLFLVFEHLEQDLSGFIDSLPSSGMPPRTLQVGRRF